MKRRPPRLKRTSTRTLASAACIVALGLGASSQAQSTGLLSRVQAVSGSASTCSALFVAFNTRMQFTGRQMEDDGRTLVLWLNRDAGEGTSDVRSEPVETHPNVTLPGLGVVQVSLDTRGSAPVLRLKFPEPISAEIQQGGESSVVVTRIGPPGRDCATGVQASAGSRQSLANEGTEDIDEARRLITSGDYSRAIQLLTRVVSKGDPQIAPDAQEMLGIARERNGQMAHARAEYQTYLDRYPDNPGASRVRQRLAAIISASSEPRSTTGHSTPATPQTETVAALPDLPPARPRARRSAAPAPDPIPEPTFRGRVSSYYYRNQGSTLFTEFETGTSDEDTDVFQDTLVTTFDFEGASESETLKRSWRLAFDHEEDFVGEGESSASLSRAYVDFEGRSRGAGIRIGRQTRNDGGVFGRFDGVEGRLPLGESLTLRVVGGSPVESSSDAVFETEKLLAGASANFDDLAPGLDFGLYAVAQTREGFDDRQAAGLEFQRQTQRSSIVGLVDYDTHFEVLNLARISGTWLGKDNSSFTLSADQGHSPLLTLGNALTGQTATTLEGLSAIYTDDEIKQLALDRTPTTNSVTLAYSRPISQHWQFSLDGTVFQTGATPASGGVAATAATGPEFFGSIQFVGSGVFRDRDTVSLSFRVADAETSDLLLLDTYFRYDQTEKLRLKPRLRLGYRVLEAGAEEAFALPSLTATYKLNKKTDFEIELGGRASTVSAPSYSEESNEAYFTLGLNRQF